MYVRKLDIGRVHKFGMERVRKFGIWARSELGIGHDVSAPIARSEVYITTAGIPNWGHSDLGAQSGRKNQPACCIDARNVYEWLTEPASIYRDLDLQ